MPSASPNFALCFHSTRHAPTSTTGTERTTASTSSLTTPLQDNEAGIYSHDTDIDSDTSPVTTSTNTNTNTVDLCSNFDHQHYPWRRSCSCQRGHGCDRPSHSGQSQEHGVQMRPSNGDHHSSRPSRSSGGGGGPMSNHVQVAKAYVFEQQIQKALHDTGVSQAREDSIRLAGVLWIDNVRRALKL